MKFSDDKRRDIQFYILNKIEQKDESISKAVSENFDINQNTVHTYINQLVDDKIIRRVRRGEYELIKEEFTYLLSRSEGHLISDTYAFDTCLQEHITELPDNVKRIWAYAFSEMMNNVMDHSGAENVVLRITRDFLNTRVMIVDDGVGIFLKIKEYFKLPSLEEAICELFKGKLTTDSENHSGEGIFFSSKMMDNFYIFSSGKVFTNNKFDKSMILDVKDKVFQSGTAVVMTLSNFSHKHAYEIFNQYSTVEGGFDTTRIPLKNAFDSSPVSRSQAKRVCNRLDDFKEVILDFDGLDWMGQGFAHQIFVVFRKAHPEINIVPINMNEEVTKMYNHVSQGIKESK